PCLSSSSFDYYSIANIIMSSEQASCLDDHRITSDLSNIETSSRIRLQLHYKDHRQDLKVEKYVSFSLTDTIRDVIKKFLETAGLDHVSPSDVSLVELGIGNQRSRPSSLSEYLTLDELNIKEGHDLYFEPSIMAATSRLFHLTIWGPSPITRVEYEWDRTTTTLKMLLEYVIKVFSLETIESQRIHLFQQLEELDLSSNADKLLIDLGIKDRSLIEVEIIPPISFSDSYIADLDHICPDDISLVALSIDNQHSAAPPSNTNMTLQQLNIKQGHVLYFEPSATVTSPRLYQLTLWGPDSLDKAEYEWDKAKTTLNMLLEYVIKIFSLESIAKERIHLVTLLESELNIMSDSDKLLSELNITDQESIFVQIVPSRSSSTVHVECAHISGTQLLDISHTTTIDEVIHQIEQRFKDHSPLNVKLFDRMHNEIDLNISNQTLSNLGINPGETIYASVRLAHSNNQSSTVDARINRALRSSSLIAKNQPGDVLVNVKFSEFDRTTIEISVNDTVDDLIKKIKALKKNRTLSIVVMSSGSILIDDKKLDHRLGDIGIKPGDAIDVIAIDKTPTYYSSTSSYVTTSSTPSRLLETRRSFSMPIGLYNLGNTCYMNSALQCLAHAKPLTEFFLDGLTQDASDDDKYLDAEWNQFYTIGTVTGAYADLLRNLYLPNKTMNYCHAFRPTHIREIIGVQAPRFATSDQQDAQEFMTFLLDEIHRELKEKNGNESNTIIEELFFGKIQSTITCLECKHEEKTTNPISFLPLPLVQQGRRFLIKFISRYGNNELAYVYVSETGQVKNLIQAFAESDSSRTLFGTIMVMANDEQLDLEMPLNQLSTREVILIEKDDFASGTQFNRLNRHTKKLTLEDCLREFCSLEPLEDSWSCQQETCKKNTKATKQLQICSLPPILIIQFKRFSHEDGLREKLETFVDYPINGLNLTSFLSSSSEDIIYDLFAVSKHTGSIYGGHYTACARHESNGKSEWYEFNDTITSSFCFDSDIVSKDAYLLFYIKRENPRQSTQITTS
ncbi:unnamed protein product, partial [Rotaria sp. Silwood1]